MTKYPRVTGINVTNFMGYEYAEAEFDDNNILNFKGYNASGKSAIIKAFWVAFFNFKQKKQARWIKHGADRFIINVTFDDGYTLQRGKLKSGKSWYILTNELEEELYSTITDGIYEQVIDVPEVIKKYLGLSYNTKLNPHFLRSRDPLFLVDTTGSENYKYLSAALQGDELLKASELAKEEQTRIKDSLSYVEHSLNVYKDIYKQAQWLTQDLVTTIEALDNQLTTTENLNTQVTLLHDLLSVRASITVLPELQSVPQEVLTQADLLQKIVDTKAQELALQPLADLQGVQTDPQTQAVALLTVYNTLKQSLVINEKPSYDSVEVPSSIATLTQLQATLKELDSLPQTVDTIETKEVPIKLIQDLQGVLSVVKESSALDVPEELPTMTLESDLVPSLTKLITFISLVTEQEELEAQLIQDLQTVKQEQQVLYGTLKEQGYDVYECSCCGELNLVGEAHVHN